MTKTVPSHTLPPKAKSVIVELSTTPEKFLESDLKASQLHSQECLYPYLEKEKLLHGTEVHQTPLVSITPVKVTLSATPEKFLESGLKGSSPQL